jgi:hypothetical protein
MEAPKQDYKQSLGRMDADEKLLAIIKRHPFGLIKLYAQMLIGLAAVAALVYFLLPEFVTPGSDSGIYSIAGMAVVVLGVIMILIAFVGTVIYNQNQLVVTDKTITQTLQDGLFNKKISQLAVSNIEDVTADTKGFFQTILNYGKLLVETAGEQENFHFDYCPHADHYAKLILETRQAFLSTREAERQEAGERYLFNQQQAGYAPQQPYASGQPAYPPRPQPTAPPSYYPPADPTAPPYSSLDPRVTTTGNDQSLPPVDPTGAAS